MTRGRRVVKKTPGSNEDVDIHEDTAWPGGRRMANGTPTGQRAAESPLPCVGLAVSFIGLDDGTEDVTQVKYLGCWQVMLAPRYLPEHEILEVGIF